MTFSIDGLNREDKLWLHLYETIVFSPMFIFVDPVLDKDAFLALITFLWWRVASGQDGADPSSGCCAGVDVK